MTYRFIPDPNAALAALKAGDVDVSGFGLGPEHVHELQKDPRFQVIVGDTTNDVILSMNNTRKPYTDVRVRRAITHGINKAGRAQGRDVRAWARSSAPTWIRSTRTSSTCPRRMPYDPAKAKKLLAEAGYPNGFDAVLKVAPQYYYTVRSGEVHRRASSQKVGVNVKIEQIEWGQWLSRSSAGRQDRRLRPVDHRPRRGVGHRQLRQPQVLLPLRQRRVPGAVHRSPRSPSTTRRAASST